MNRLNLLQNMPEEPNEDFGRRNFIKERLQNIKDFSKHFSMLYQQFSTYVQPRMCVYKDLKLCNNHLSKMIKSQIPLEHNDQQTQTPTFKSKYKRKIILPQQPIFLKKRGQIDFNTLFLKTTDFSYDIISETTGEETIKKVIKKNIPIPVSQLLQNQQINSKSSKLYFLKDMVSQDSEHNHLQNQTTQQANDLSKYEIQIIKKNEKTSLNFKQIEQPKTPSQEDKRQQILYENIEHQPCVTASLFQTTLIQQKNETENSLFPTLNLTNNTETQKPIFSLFSKSENQNHSLLSVQQPEPVSQEEKIPNKLNIEEKIPNKLSIEENIQEIKEDNKPLQQSIFFGTPAEKSSPKNTNSHQSNNNPFLFSSGGVEKNNLTELIKENSSSLFSFNQINPNNSMAQQNSIQESLFQDNNKNIFNNLVQPQIQVSHIQPSSNISQFSFQPNNTFMDTSGLIFPQQNDFNLQNNQDNPFVMNSGGNTQGSKYIISKNKKKQRVNN